MEDQVELDGRHSAGIDVQLLWDRRTEGLTVVAHDMTTDETFTIYVDPDDALEVFRHPFAYAPQQFGRTGVRVKAN
jgi:hypothetical protein